MQPEVNGGVNVGVGAEVSSGGLVGGEKVKKSRGWVIATVVCAAVAIVGVGFGVYGMMKAGRGCGGTNCGVESGQVSGEGESGGGATESGEVEIKDTLLLRDLDRKMAVLHLAYGQSGATIQNRGMLPELQLYKEGDLSEVAKLSHLVASLGDYENAMAVDELRVFAADFGEQLGEMATGMIDAKVVAEGYLDLYGKPLELGALNGEYYCPQYVYDARLDAYVDVSACGGTGPYRTYYYKNRYTTEGERAYVYVSAGMTSGEDFKIYCDVTTGANGPTGEVCGEIASNEAFDEFTIDESNYKDFQEYRFVFERAGDGTYYFTKVEKM